MFVLSLFLLFAPTTGRKYETHPACYAGPSNVACPLGGHDCVSGVDKHTRMPNWARDNVAKCIPIYETNVTHDNTIHSSVRFNEWKFFHFAMNDFNAVNRVGGSKIRVSASPCHGSVHLFVKPGLNFNGEPMNQMFETIPGTEGLRTDTWPFPDNHTGNVAQGPEAHMMEPGWEYPGALFTEMKWGFNSMEFGKENIVKTKILHGSYFISVYGHEDRDNSNNCGSVEDGLEPCCGDTLTCSNNFTISVSMEPDETAEEMEIEKAKATARQTSMKTRKIEGAHGEYLLVEWAAPKEPNLINLGEFGDQSTQLDLNSFDQYQVYWASDSQTFYDFLEPNDEGWGYKLIPNGAVRHEFLEKEPGFCYWPHFNTSNMTSLQSMAPSPSAMEDYMETLTPSSANEYAEYINDEFGPNASYPTPPNTDCIMDTECGIQNNGIPAYIKVKRNWETDVKGLGLVREICTAVMDDASGLEVEECVRNPTADAPVRKPDPKAKEFVRYEMQVNRHGEGGDEGVECGRATYVMPGLKDPKTNTWIGKYNRSNGFKCTKGMPLTRVSVNGHVNTNYCDRGLSEITRRCKPGLQCTYKLLDEKYRCEKTYLRPDTAIPEETDLFVRTRVPHDCWKTGEDYCKKGTKIIDVPPVERRVKIEITNNKYTERWQPWDKDWRKKYMDAPNSKECRSVLFKQADHHPGVTHSHQHFVGCTWDLKPGQIPNEQYERDIGDYSIWKLKCGDPCRVDFSFLNAPLRMRVPSIEMTFDGSQSTRFGLDGIIHASSHEVNGLNNQKDLAKERQKLYASLEEAFTAVFTAHGIASAVDAVSDSDVLVLQSRCDLEVTTPTDGISAEKHVYTIPMGPMPCSEPFVCTFMHWRSREVKVNVVRKKCVKIMKHPMLGYKCAQFEQLKELYSGTKGNTTYDQESQGASDNTIMWIGMGVGFVLAILVSIIMFMKVRTSMRLNKAYDHVDKHLAGQPATIDRRRSEHHLKERAKHESGQEKQKQLWDKKSKMIKQNIQKKKDEFKRRMKAIKKENQRRERDLREKMEFEALERAKLNKRRAKIREHRADIARKKAEQEYNKILAAHHDDGHKK